MPENIERLHQHFREEFAAAHAFFLWKGINNCAANDWEVYRSINEQALSWNIITHSLQTTFFIALGRLFDADGDAFSVHSYLRSCIENIDQFSATELRKRKIAANNGNVPDWLEEYMLDAYVPCESDFQRLRGELSKRQKQCEEIHRPIRNQIFAHKDAESMENVESLFEKTRIDQIEELLSFLYQIQEVVWQFLVNGRRSSVGDFALAEEEYVVDDARDMLARLRIGDPLEDA